MHNLGTVYRFEVLRTLKKKSFWILALGVPVLIGAIFAVVYFSNRATNDVVSKLKDQKFSMTYTDESGLVNPDIAKAIGLTTTTDKNAAIDAVKNGKQDAYFYYPKDLEKNQPEVYGKDVGIFENGRYAGVASSLLDESVNSTLTPSVRNVASGKVNFTNTVYRDGKPYDSMAQVIAPGLFLILFYFVIAFFGNQMLNSTIEEKENRVIEMILTTIKPDTLILGKILSLFTLIVIQIVIILVPIIVAYILFGSQLNLPEMSFLQHIPLDPVRIGVGAAIFLASLMMFTGLLIAVGAASPTAKEAGSFFGLIMMLIFGPLYAVTLFVSAPESPIVQVLSNFPLTAPIPLMLRNAVGNLSAPEAALGITILLVTAIVIFMIAVRLFRFGALEYSNRVKLSSIFARNKSM